MSRRAIRTAILCTLNKLLRRPTVSIDLHQNERRKTLVLMLTHLGDCVIHFPFLQSMVTSQKCALPIHLLVKQPLLDIFTGSSDLLVTGFRCPWVGAGGWLKGFMEWVKLVRRLRYEKFDFVIVTHPHFLTSLTARLSGATYTFGYVEPGDNILHQGIIVPSEDHVSKRSDSLLKKLKIKYTGKTDWYPFDTAKVVNGREIIKKVLFNGANRHASKRVAVCLHPGAGGSAKIWPWQNFVALLTPVLSKIDCTVVLVGGPSESEACRLICAALKDNCIVFDLSCKLDVAELYGAFSVAAFYVGNDSGPSHLAAASGIPVFTVFGPASRPAVWKPSGSLSTYCHIEDASFYEESSVSTVFRHFQEFLNVKAVPNAESQLPNIPEPAGPERLTDSIGEHA